MSKTPTTLIIMDGFGVWDERAGNAIAAARTPNLDKIFAENPGCRLSASGLDVGLPEGQMGNSEVGHTNIGAGRVVFQDLPRISRAIEDGSFFENEAYIEAMDDCKERDGALHLMGLLSDGGVHSHITHLFALLEMAKKRGLGRVYVHCFLDGRDVPPASGKGYVEKLVEKCKEVGVGQVATVMGRYYAMDRDKRWDRVQRAYDAMTRGEGVQNPDPVDAVQRSYDAGVTDEFVEPVVCTKDGKVKEGDSIIFINFRPDRAREITRCFVDPAFTDVERKIYFAEDMELSPIACAYVRARGADRLCSYGDWAALSDVCDADTARYLALEVSDGVIAPGYTDEALAILKTKRKGGYNVVQIDPDYAPKAVEHKDVFGITFEQGRNSFAINEALLDNIVTDNKELPESAKRDMLIALITLKYTQSNSVCYVKNGMTIGVGAGQQSRIHCTRLAGSKADNWYLRQHPKTLALQFVDGIRRPDRDNAIDVYLSDEYEDVLADGVWQNTFEIRPEVLTAEEKKEWIARQSGVTVGSDAFFPFGDNVERARKSGVQYIVQPGGSIRDDHVIATCNKYGIVMAFTGMRLFHH